MQKYLSATILAVGLIGGTLYLIITRPVSAQSQKSSAKPVAAESQGSTEQSLLLPDGKIAGAKLNWQGRAEQRESVFARSLIDQDFGLQKQKAPGPALITIGKKPVATICFNERSRKVAAVECLPGVIE